MSDKPCAKCGERPRRKHGAWCKPCHNDGQRKRPRKPRSEWSPERKAKMYARSMVRSYVARGYLKKMPCQVCGQVDGVEAHHHMGYDKPLHVEWYCRKHHDEVHQEKGYDHDMLPESHKVGHRVKAMDKSSWDEDAKKMQRAKRKLFGGDDE